MFVKFLFIFAFLKICSAEVTIGNNTVDVKSEFERGCYNEITEYTKNLEKGSNLTSPADVINVTSIECLMFCGYKKVGIVDNDGNVKMDVLKSLAAPEEATFESAILNCTTTTEKTANVCTKALKNIKCIFAEVSWSLIGTISVKLLVAYAGPY